MLCKKQVVQLSNLSSNLFNSFNFNQANEISVGCISSVNFAVCFCTQLRSFQGLDFNGGSQYQSDWPLQ